MKGKRGNRELEHLDVGSGKVKREEGNSGRRADGETNRGEGVTKR